MDTKERWALLSVYHKVGIVNFAENLLRLGFRLMASGGTAKMLTDAGFDVLDIAKYVGEPILGHRVVTLSREIFAGILARDCPEDREELARHGIHWIDLVCVDTYPLQQEASDPKHTRSSVIEKVDIGGPTLLRAAAKARRLVCWDEDARNLVLDHLESGCPNRCPDHDRFVDDLAIDAEHFASEYSQMAQLGYGRTRTPLNSGGK